MSMSRTRLWQLRALLGAGALVSGGATAYATAPRSVAVHAPRATASPRVRSSHRVSAPAPDAASNTDAEIELDSGSPDDTGAARLVDSFGESLRDGKIISGATPHRLILFTFDDGPDKRYTPRLLDDLDRLGVRAVFFLSAHRIRGINRTERDQAEIAREIVRRGHLVGNHTTFHVALPTLDTDAVEKELAGSEEIFVRVFGKRSWLFRPPYGVHTPRTDAILSARGYTQMFWNIGTGDFQVRDADSVVRTWKNVHARREAELGERGGVVLIHDTHEWSVDAFPRIVEEIRRRNCALLSTDEELYDIVDDPALFFAARREAPASEVADPARPAPEVLAERQRTLRAREQLRCANETAIVAPP
jgi:peptidoglycan/xylan/chitin deacetylase (PgdA/CDA1 family)